MYTIAVDARPTRLLNTGDGSMWFVFPQALQLGFIRQHRLHYLSVKSSGESPLELLQDRNGALWMVPMFGTRLLQIENDGIGESVAVSSVNSVVQGGAFLPDGSLALALGSDLKTVDLGAKRVLMDRRLSAVPTRIAVFGNSIWLLEPSLNRIEIVERTGAARFIAFPRGIEPKNSSALLVTENQVFVGIAGGVYAASKSGLNVHRVSVNTTGIVSVLKVVDGDVWYGTYEGDAGYIKGDVSYPVRFLDRVTASALNCGSIVPSEWLQ